MFFFFLNNNSIRVEIGSSPNEADIAITSTSTGKTPGLLNEFVIQSLGYSNTILHLVNVERGYGHYEGDNKKLIIFVVTVGEKSTKENLEINLSNALLTYADILENKKVWIPLMGTGEGGLKLKDSLEITKNIIERFLKLYTNIKFEPIIALPDSSEGKFLYDKLAVESNKNKVNFHVNKLDLEKTAEIKKEINLLEKEKNEAFNNRFRVIEGLKKIKANYYFVGYDYWDDNYSDNDFYENNFWDTGHTEKTILVNRVRIGDVLILKTSVAIGNNNYLKIEALGIVTGNPGDGATLDVNWIIKDLTFRIEDFDYNNTEISIAKEQYVIEILSRINPESFEKFTEFQSKIIHEVNNQVQYQEKNGNGNAKIAGLLCDTEKGEDYLNIKNDVEAFSRVIAAKSFHPPLAIALLGKWGSGKSFFMTKLKEKIKDLSEENPEEQFCEGIAHVHFNAWSYMDSNLWASIVTRIFEGLQEYISGDSKANSFKKEIEKKLTKNLNITKDELGELEKLNKTIRSKLAVLYKEKRKATAELEGKIKEIESSTLDSILDNLDKKFKVREKITQAFGENPTYAKSEQQFKEIVPEKYWDFPEEFFQQVSSNKTFLKSFFRSGTWWVNWLCLIVIILLLIYTPIFTSTSEFLASHLDFTLTPNALGILTVVGPLFIHAVNFYKKYQPLIASFWKIKEDYEKEKANALFVFKQKEKALHLQIENYKQDINRLDQQIYSAKIKKAEIEFKLENALSTDALFTFIEKRANSEDYKKHLGVVSIIRKDLEVLSDLLTDHNAEAAKNKESIEFKKLFDNPLERIILYIDDLDRCPEERVVEVLESVNLLMAFPLFVVVVGVDPRWVKNALIKKHHMQFTGQIGKNENKELEMIEASSYLEKIFQVPFHLKDASDGNVKNMIEKLALIKPALDVNLVAVSSNNEGIVSSKGKIVENLSGNRMTVADYADINTEKNPTDSTPKYQEAVKKEQLINALNISKEEIAGIQNLTSLIGANPRSIKRFINIYRIIKTHEDFNLDENNSENKLPCVMFLLAMSIGRYNNYMKEFEKVINTPQYKSYTLINLKTSFPEVYDALANNEQIMKLSCKDFAQHYQFIKRFTFKNI